MRILSAVTRVEVPEPPTGVLRYVVPGSGGGNGTVADPYLGLQAAADAAVPRDVFVVAPGAYSAFEIEQSEPRAPDRVRRSG